MQGLLLARFEEELFGKEGIMITVPQTSKDFLKKRKEAKRQKIIANTQNLYLTPLYSGSTTSFPQKVSACKGIRDQVLREELLIPYDMVHDGFDVDRKAFYVAAVLTRDNSIHIGTVRGRVIAKGIVEASGMALRSEWRRKYIGTAMHERFEIHCRDVLKIQRVIAFIPRICEEAELFFGSLGFSKVSSSFVMKGSREQIPCIEYAKSL